MRFRDNGLLGPLSIAAVTAKKDNTDAMKIEFLPERAQACPLIRLFAYKPGEVARLRRACRDLADGQIAEFVLHDQPWVERVADCRFIWRASSEDRGVVLPALGSPFVLEFSDEAWREVEDKLLPFAEDSGGDFTWLTNEGDVNVLISESGQW